MEIIVVFLAILSLPLFISATPLQHETLTQGLQGHQNYLRTNIKSVENDSQEEPQLIAGLDYGTFKGAYSKEYNISYFQKIPFAAPPVGENRFRGPQPPLNLTSLHGEQYIYDSAQPFDMCPQRTVNGSEDCLYLALYSRPWFPKTNQPLRPVVVVFYGGGFIRGAASFSNLPPSAYPVLNVSSGNDLVFIYPNYRTNAFGFLAGQQVVENYPFSDTNVGLLDQRAATRWAKKYVHLFGGDRESISIWGQSAGGGSVVAQVIADQDFDSHDHPGELAQEKSKGKNKLFKRALASSPYWPKTYSSTGPEAQWMYDTLVNRTGCSYARYNFSSSGPNKDPNSTVQYPTPESGAVLDLTLSCLKRAPVQAIRDAAEYIASSHTYTTSSYTFAPMIDGRFLPRTLSQAAEDLQINADTILATYNTHEGENFLPPLLHDDDLESSSPTQGSISFTNWLKDFLLDLTEADIADVKNLYPPTGITETANYSSVQVRAGLIYRDVVLACPAYWLTGAASSSSSSSSSSGNSSGGRGGGGGYLAEYTITPAKHASEVNWWNTPNQAQQTKPLVYTGFVGAFASFSATGDPNERKLTPPEIPGLPKLTTGKEEDEEGEGQEQEQEEFIIQSDGFSTAKITHLKQRCDFWKSLAHRIPI